LASISIVIPAYNEMNRLPATLSRVIAYLGERSFAEFEIIVVDDGSSDSTAAVVEQFSRAHSEVRLVRNPGNRGKGFSVRRGMGHAAGDWLLFSDADLSAPIEELDKLLSACNERNADVAIGSRALNRSLIGVHQSPFREYAGQFFNLLMRLIVGLPFWDTQCGFKLFRREAARQIFPRQQLDGFGFDVEVLFIAQLRGLRTVEIPVRWNHTEGTKVRMLSDSTRMFADLLRVRWNQLRGCYR
jgi:glycosyltransferase involved in cell wall biosynthesis